MVFRLQLLREQLVGACSSCRRRRLGAGRGPHEPNLGSAGSSPSRSAQTSNPACAAQAPGTQADAQANKSQHEVSGQSAKARGKAGGLHEPIESTHGGRIAVWGGEHRALAPIIGS